MGFMTLHDWAAIPLESMTPLLGRRVLHTERCTLARLEMKKGAVVPVHSHDNEQVTSVISGRLLFRSGDTTQEVGPGEMLLLPSWLPHGVEVLEDAVVLDLFVPRREDWIRGDDAYLRK
jgi:quercetin dioxygenase-like cupin family protein